MRCDDAIEALSARIDGESALGVEADALDAHLADCEPCRATEARFAALHRRVRIRPAQPVPDLSAAIVGRVAPSTPGRAFARASLAGAAAALAFVSLPVLLTRPGPHAHDVRHFAIYDLALAAGFAYVAVRPWVARALLPLLGGLGVLMLVGALVDTALGGGDTLGDSHHLLQFAGIALVVALARPPGEGWTARRQVARRAHPAARAPAPDRAPITVGT